MKSAVALPVESAVTRPALRSVPVLVLDLVKARLTFLVLVTTLVGFCMGLNHGLVDYKLLTLCMLGTAFSAAGAAALNQLIERKADAKMRRTQLRPLPTGEMKPLTAMAIGICFSVFGVTLLALQVNSLSAWVSIATILSYVFLYTPLKRITSLNTLVGAIPGALPPVIGYAASAQQIDAMAVALFAILFFWQLPHFLAISWLYREDYLLGGFVMISGRDTTGRETSWKAFCYTLFLIASSATPFFLGTNNSIFLIGSIVFGLIFLWFSIRFLQQRDSVSARQLFFTSIIYLPLFLGLLVFTRR